MLSSLCPCHAIMYVARPQPRRWPCIHHQCPPVGLWLVHTNGSLANSPGVPQVHPGRPRPSGSYTNQGIKRGSFSIHKQARPLPAVSSHQRRLPTPEPIDKVASPPTSYPRNDAHEKIPFPPSSAERRKLEKPPGYEETINAYPSCSTTRKGSMPLYPSECLA